MPWKTATRQRRSSDAIPADIMSVLPGLGVEVTKVTDGEATALCPGPHTKRTGGADRSPSWSVNLRTGQHHCFSCGWGGPFVVLVKYIEGLDDEKAERWIKDHGGMEYVRSRLEGRTDWEKPQAEEVSEARLVMFDDPPRWALNDKDVDLASCLRYGVRWCTDKMVIGTGEESHTVPADTWIFPVRDPVDNHLMGWQEKGKGYFNNYPPHLEKSLTIFGFGLLRAGQRAYVYESPIDAVRLDSYGQEGGVSTYGVHISDRQIDLLSDRTDDVCWCLDNDGPGRSEERALWKESRHRFRKMSFACYYADDPKDHGEMPIEDVWWSIDNAISKLRFRP